ncbi:transposase [Corallococcus sp. AS-1-12]|nr:transposase [Corallococcus sp. AS-1-12]
MLTWSWGGFVLLYKWLETGRFRLPPVDAGAQAVTLDATQWAMLLDGIEIRVACRSFTRPSAPTRR